MTFASTSLRRLLGSLATLAVIAAAAPLVVGPTADAQRLSAAQINAELGVGVNLGNALEAPREGDWGLTLSSSYFANIAQRGFDHVRVPIRFSAYSSLVPPYTITDGVDPTVPNANNLWERVDWVIANAEANGLYVILDLHHFHELSDDVVGERDRFLAIWNQIATRYADTGSLVLFELLNEPRGQFIDDPALLNQLIADALAVIRVTNPTRPVLIGPTNSNSLWFLDDLVLPSDPNLIASFHFYEPFDFTHQGAGWIEPEPPPLTSFQPDLVGHGAGWGDWSWSTTTIPTVNGLRVQHQNRWAGLMFGRPNLIDPVSLNATISGSARLRVRCLLNNGLSGDDGNQVVATFDTSEAVFPLDLTACPSDTRGINFMVVSETFDELLYTDVELCDAQGVCHDLLQTGRQAMETAFDTAHAWGLANGIPINVGEFGTFSANDQAVLAERAAWTQMVRQLGRDRGFSMSYWEFGAGFGVYDPNTDMWIEPIAQALGIQPGPGCGTSFSDVATNAYYADAVQWAACAGITTGTSATTFGPNQRVTRAQVATFLWRYGGYRDGAPHSFTDVPVGAYFDEPVAWMAGSGITTGTTPTTFSPSATVTRAQIATFLWRFSGSPAAPSSGFSDVPAGSYFETPVGWMNQNGITTGTSATTFGPDLGLTRAQVVTFLWRHAGRP